MTKEISINYNPDVIWVGEKTIYVFVHREKIGWIAARQEHEQGMIYFCFNH